MGLEGLLRLDPRALRDALRRGDAADLSPAERERLEQHIRSRLRDASQNALDVANPLIETTVADEADRLHRQWVDALEEFEGVQDFTPPDPEEIDTGEGADDVLGPARTQDGSAETPTPNEPQQILYDLQGGRRVLDDEELRQLHARSRLEAESRAYETHRLDWPPLSPSPAGWLEESHDWRALQRYLGERLDERGIRPIPRPKPRPYRLDIGNGVSLVAVDAANDAETTAEQTAAEEPTDDGDAEQDDGSSRRSWRVIAVGAGVAIALTIFGVVQALSSDETQTIAAEEATSTTAEPTTTSAPPARRPRLPRRRPRPPWHRSVPARAARRQPRRRLPALPRLPRPHPRRPRPPPRRRLSPRHTPRARRPPTSPAHHPTAPGPSP